MRSGGSTPPRAPPSSRRDPHVLGAPRRRAVRHRRRHHLGQRRRARSGTRRCSRPTGCSPWRPARPRAAATLLGGWRRDEVLARRPAGRRRRRARVRPRPRLHGGRRRLRDDPRTRRRPVRAHPAPGTPAALARRTRHRRTRDRPRARGRRRRRRGPGRHGFSRLRITVTSASALRQRPGRREPTLVVTSPPAPWPATTTLATVPWSRNERSAIAGLKTTSYAENAIALAEAKRRGASEAVLADTRAGCRSAPAATSSWCSTTNCTRRRSTRAALAGVTRASSSSGRRRRRDPRVAPALRRARDGRRGLHHVVDPRRTRSRGRRPRDRGGPVTLASRRSSSRRRGPSRPVNGLLVFVVALLAWVLLSARASRGGASPGAIVQRLTPAGLARRLAPRAVDIRGRARPWPGAHRGDPGGRAVHDASSIGALVPPPSGAILPAAAGIGFPLILRARHPSRSVAVPGHPWVAFVIGAALAPTDAALARRSSRTSASRSPSVGHQRRERPQRRSCHPGRRVLASSLATADPRPRSRSRSSAVVARDRRRGRGARRCGLWSASRTRAAAASAVAEGSWRPCSSSALGRHYASASSARRQRFVAVRRRCRLRNRPTTGAARREHRTAPVAPDMELFGAHRRLMALGVWFVFGAAVALAHRPRVDPACGRVRRPKPTVLRMVPVAVAASARACLGTPCSSRMSPARVWRRSSSRSRRSTDIGGSDGDFVRRGRHL